jgi:hypothetical protein
MKRADFIIERAMKEKEVDMKEKEVDLLVSPERMFSSKSLHFPIS